MSTKFSAQVMTADGRPLVKGEVSVHTQRGARLLRCGSGHVQAGQLSAEADDQLGPCWGLRIDGRAVLAWAKQQSGDQVELLPLQMLAEPLALPAFHALRGQVWGLPRALQGVEPIRQGEAASRAGSATSQVRSRALPVAMSELVADAAAQIHRGASGSAGLQLSVANVRLSGLGAKVGEQLSMQFPSTAEELASAAVTSVELTFSPAAVEAAPPTPPPVPTVPQVTGYTRELAVRKLAAAQYAAQVRVAATSSERDAGRVLRQLPVAGQPLLAGQVVLLFVAQGAATPTGK